LGEGKNLVLQEWEFKKSAMEIGKELYNNNLPYGTIFE
jgi:hypothetical protein